MTSGFALLLGVLLSCAPALAETRAAISNAVAVLDFKADGDFAPADDWTVGLADYVELALQKEGVPTLERRQIRLILGERDLETHGALAAGTLQEVKLPAVAYFVSGTVSRTGADGFALTLSVVQAGTAAVKASWTRRGLYSQDWLSAIQSLAANVRSELQTPEPSLPARSDSESLTWLPEAALPFFKGLNLYSRGDYAQAIPWFREASGKAGHFDQARLWEARASRQGGLPMLAEFALKPVKPWLPAATNLPARLPVVAVIGTEGVSAAGRAVFVEALKQSGRFRLFDPGSIQATAREIDLQLSGQMAAPLNERSVWLVIDSVILLDEPGGTPRARQRDLLSGELLRQTRASSPSGRGDEAYAVLAKAFLENPRTADSPADTNSSLRDLSEPDAHDTPASAFAKTWRLVIAHPDNARYWVALSDSYGDWNARMWILGQAIKAVQSDRHQPDASYWLASALWRKRLMSRWAWLYSEAPSYTELPLTNEFARLLEWYPKSPEAKTALQEVTRKSGMYVYSDPSDRRFLGAVFGNIGPARRPMEAPPAPASKVTDMQRLARLGEIRSRGDDARAWLVADSLRDSKDPAIRAQAQPAYDALLKRLVEQDQQFKAFNAACDRRQTEAALNLGRQLLGSIQRKARLAVIDRCGGLLKKKGNVDAWFQFVFEQAGKYKEDFDFDPVTGAPMTVILDFVLEENPARAERWTTSACDLEYARLMGDLAEEMQARQRPDLCARVFEALGRDQALPARNRLTAAYDLALAQYRQGKVFDALESLKELLRQTEGTDTPVARKTGWTGEQVEGAAFDLLRRIRLYCDGETDFTRCCGEPAPAPMPGPELAKEMNQLLGELWENMSGGVGAENRAIREKLLQRKNQLMPLLLYKLWRGEDAARVLAFCGEMGTNAAAALPYLPRYLCYSDSFPECNNALSAFCGIGKPAACATPLLILAAEGTASTFNAEAALRRVGPAPPKVMPYLAKLLYHKNPGVRKRAAKAILQTPRLQAADVHDKSDEELIAFVRKWWETDGMKVQWQE